MKKDRDQVCQQPQQRTEDSRITSSREKNKCYLRILYLAKLSFKNEREIKTFLDNKWIGLTSTKLSLNYPQKRVFQEEEKWSQKKGLRGKKEWQGNKMVNFFFFFLKEFPDKRIILNFNPQKDLE